MSRAVEPEGPAAKAFVASKLRLLHSHARLDLKSRDSAMAELVDRLGMARSSLHEMMTAPAPGGVGYGMFYEPSFRSAIDKGTSLYFDAIALTRRVAMLATGSTSRAPIVPARAMRWSPLWRGRYELRGSSTGPALSNGR